MHFYIFCYFISVEQKEDNTLIYIIIACAVTGLLIIIILILICLICCKKKSKQHSEHKISKKFVRSNQQPVVVMSERSSQMEIENESTLLPVSTIQNTSPPPAYTSVVNEQKSDTVVKQENTNTTSKKNEKKTRMKTSDKNASSMEKKEDGRDKAIVKADTSNPQTGVKENTHSESTTVTSETNNNGETLDNENDVTEPTGVSTNLTAMTMTTDNERIKVTEQEEAKTKTKTKNNKLKKSNNSVINSAENTSEKSNNDEKTDPAVNKQAEPPKTKIKTKNISMANDIVNKNPETVEMLDYSVKINNESKQTNEETSVGSITINDKNSTTSKKERDGNNNKKKEHKNNEKTNAKVKQSVTKVNIEEIKQTNVTSRNNILKDQPNEMDDGEISMIENNSLLQSAEKSHDVEQTREILKHNSNNETTLKPVREGFVERSSKDQPHIAPVHIKSSEKLSNKRTSNNSANDSVPETFTRKEDSSVVEIDYNSSIIDKAGISKVNTDDDINTSERSKVKRHDDINTSERTLSDNTQLDNNSISIGGIVTENSRKMSSNDNTSTISSTDSLINKTDHSYGFRETHSTTKSRTEPTLFTISNGTTNNFQKSNDRKTLNSSSSYRSNSMFNNKQNMAGNNNNVHQKIDEESYTKKLDALKTIYYSHSKYGQRDKNILRMRTQVDIDLPRRPPTSKVNPWLVQPKEDTPNTTDDRQVTKATILRRMRTMGVQEALDENIPQLIPRAHAFTILRSRTTLCDEDLVQSRRKTLPALRGVPKQEMPELPMLWKP